MNSWEISYWYVIESIINQLDNNNEGDVYSALKSVGKFIPCLECKVHFDRFLSRYSVTDSDFLVRLKMEIDISKKAKQKKCCIRTKPNRNKK